jgi:hypothetical protein
MRVFRTILGMVLLTVGLPTLLGGGGLWAVMQHRDPGGAFSGELQRLTVPGYAVVIPDIDRLLRDDAPFARIGGTQVRLSAATVDGRAFLGLAPSDEVARYLAGVPYTQIDAIDIGTGLLPVTTSRVGGRRAPTGTPAEQPFWTASGPGQISLTPGELTDRPYSLVLMNPGGAPVLRVAVVAEVRPGWLNSSTWGLLTLGTLLVMAGVIVLVWPGRRREVVYVVEPSQVPELMHAIGAPLPLPGGVAYFTGTRTGGGAHRPRTLADVRPRPPALPQFAWPPNASAPGTPALPVLTAGEPVTLSTATLNPTPGGTPTDDLLDDDDLPGPGYPPGRTSTGTFTGPAVPPAGPAAGSRPGPRPTGTTLTAPLGSPAPGSPVTGSPAPGSPVAGSAVTGSAVTGSAVTGSAVTGSAVTGSAVTGSAVTGSAVSGPAGVNGPRVTGPAVAGSRAGGSSSSGPAGAATPSPAGAATGSVGSTMTGVAPVGARTPAPGQPLSKLGESSPLTGLQAGQVPTRRGDRRPQIPAELPPFQATAVGAWVAATAPERARQTEARAAARLAEAARRNAGKFAPTQPGSRNMPANARIPIAPPRRDNGDLPTQSPDPKNTPTTASATATTDPSLPEAQTESPSEATAATGSSRMDARTEPSSEATAATGSSRMDARTEPSSEATAATGSSRMDARTESSSEATAATGSSRTDARTEPSSEAAAMTGSSRIEPSSEAVRAAGSSLKDARTESSGAGTAKVTGDPETEGCSADPTSRDGEGTTAPLARTSDETTDPSVPRGEPTVNRIALHTGPAATDWIATGISRLGPATAPAPRPAPRPSPKPAPVPSRPPSTAKGGAQAPPQKRSGADDSRQPLSDHKAGSPPEWPPLGEPAVAAETARTATGTETDPAKPTRSGKDAGTPVKAGPAKSALIEKEIGSPTRLPNTSEKDPKADSGRPPVTPIPAPPAPLTQAADPLPKPSTPSTKAGDSTMPGDLAKAGDATMAGDLLSKPGDPSTEADTCNAEAAGETSVAWASIHTVEASIQALDQSAPAAEQPATGITTAAATPAGERRSVHAVEAEGLAVLPKKPSPVPTRGTAGRPDSGASAAAGFKATTAEAKAAAAGDEATVVRDGATVVRDGATAAADKGTAAGNDVTTAGEKRTVAGGEGTSAGDQAIAAGTKITTAGEKSAPTVGGKTSGTSRARKVVTAKVAGDDLLARAQGRAGGNVLPGRPAPTARRAPAAWIKAAEKAAESVAARAGRAADVPATSRTAGNPEAPAGAATSRTTGNPEAPAGAATSRTAGNPEAPAGAATSRTAGNPEATAGAGPAPATRGLEATAGAATGRTSANREATAGAVAGRTSRDQEATAAPAPSRTAGNPETAAANRPLSYREEAAELLGGERRRRRTVSGRSRPKTDPPANSEKPSPPGGDTGSKK